MNRQINYLDITIQRTQRGFSTNIYRKPTTTDSIIPNDSWHPICHKMAAIHYIYNMMNTYQLSQSAVKQEENTIIQILSNNKYDSSILDKVKHKKENPKPKQDNKNHKWAKFTYTGRETLFITKIFKKPTSKLPSPRTTQSKNSYQKNWQVRNLPTRMPHMQYEVLQPNWTTISNPIPGTSEGLQIQQLQIQIRPTPPRKTTRDRQNGEHHERITHNWQSPDDEHNREILHIPGNKNGQPNKRQTDSPTKRYLRNYIPIRYPQRAPGRTRPPNQPPIPTLRSSTQSDREQTSVMHNTKNYDKPRGQPPEPLHKLRNSK